MLRLKSILHTSCRIILLLLIVFLIRFLCWNDTVHDYTRREMHNKRDSIYMTRDLRDEHSKQISLHTRENVENRLIQASYGHILNNSKVIPSNDSTLSAIKLSNHSDSVLNNTTVKISTTTKKNGNLTIAIDKCDHYVREASQRHRVYVNVLGAGRNTSGDILCLLTQLTYTRLYMLQRVAQNWKGPISATVYVKESQYDSCKEQISEWLSHTGRVNIAVHFVITQGMFYPVNRLRNVAQQNTEAKYIFMNDVDFVPNKDMYSNILEAIEGGFFNATEKKALVIPAFELTDAKYSFPQTKTDVRLYYRQNVLSIFHKKNISLAHGATRYIKWFLVNNIYKIRYKEHYEPYVVLKRDITPPYDERFVQRFYNKVSHIQELHARGWEFWALPNGYLIHMPHKYEKSFFTNSVYQCSRLMWNRFLTDLHQKLQEEHKPSP